MNSKGNSVVGFALIGIILLVFSWYNSKQYDKQAEAQRHYQDSIALVEYEKAMADSAAAAALRSDTLHAPVLVEEPSMFQDSLLDAAYKAEAAYYTLENDKVRVSISSKGAQPYEVLIKDYYTFDSLDLYLVRPEKSSLDFEINANQWLNTSDFCFDLVSASDDKVVLRLPFGESYIDAEYTLAPDTYMVDFNMHFVGMDKVLDRSATAMTMNWVMDVPRLEKGYKNERNYSAVAYRFAGENGDVKTLGQRKESSHEDFAARLRWVGFQQQFFSAILVADNDFAGGTMVNKFYAETNPDRDLMQSGAKMSMELDTRSADFDVPMHFYFGPNHFPTLKSYGQSFEKIIPLGGKVIGTISRYVIIPTFNWLSKSISSYGLIILILTLMIKFVISPLTWKSYSSSAKMKVLKPEIDKINAKYPKQEDALKKQQATMDLYKRAGVSTMGGCLPVLLQFPILWAMFRFFPASIELRQQGFLWAKDLSAYDSILDFGFNLPLYGDHVSLFALLMGITMWGYSRMTMGNIDDSQMPGMKFMNVWLMPIMMVFICNNLSAGLSYYYMLSNIITIGMNWAIRKWFVDEDKIYARLREKTAKAAPPKKSKFQQRLEAMQKMQEQQMKQKR